MATTPIEIYCDAFTARGRHEMDRQQVLSEPGVRGVVLIRLLVSDDSGYDRLVAETAAPWHGAIFVLDRATRCLEFMRSLTGWSGHSEMAMALRDLDSLAPESFPDGFELRSVKRGDSEEPNAVPLDAAAAVAKASDPSITDSPEQMMAFLGGLPPSVRLFAAVDESGVPHATSSCHVFGKYTQIGFVTTEPAWRRRGLGRAMTLGALRAAASLGANTAILHATPDGLPVYRHLGFEDVGMLTRYSFAG